MKSRVVNAIAALALGAASWLAGDDAAAKTLKLSLYVPLDSMQGKAAQEFKRLVEEKTAKSLEIRLFPSNQLGGPYDVIDAQSAGSIEMSLLGFDIYSKFSPVVNLSGLAFIFADRDHAFAFFNSPLHEKAKDEILKSKQVRVIGGSEWNQGPYKILLSKDPVRSTADLKGMSMRVPNTEIDLLVWGPNGAGAAVNPIPWQEAQLAMRQGLVKAIELPADFVVPFKFHETAKNLALTRHRHQVVYMTIADKVWQELTPAERKALADANAEAGAGYTKNVLSFWENEQAMLKSQGVTIVDFDVSEWHRKAVAIARDLEAKAAWEKGLVDRLLALRKTN